MITHNHELVLLQRALEKLAAGFACLPEFKSATDESALAIVLDEVAERMQDNYPYFHPQYAGQMLKPPHPIARIAYAMSLWINPNNHALDGGRASSAMEKDCIAELGAMFGWTKLLGHLTGGGTMANLEALWVAAQLHPGKRIVASNQAHYTHERISKVLGLSFSSLAVDNNGCLEIGALEEQLRNGDIGTVVVSMGNTGLGAIDPLSEIMKLRHRFDFRIHADAAYGGYFGLADGLSDYARQHYGMLSKVDSIVIDPHKHGLQPFGCGCILFEDASVGRFYQHGSPYTYFSSAEMHLGEISLECSRPGAAAVALWATQKLLPLIKHGEFAQGLDDCLTAARDFYTRLDASPFFTPLMPPELDIVVYAVNARSTTEAGVQAREIFHRAAQKQLHLALIELPTSFAEHWLPDCDVDSESVTCLRSVLMKPEHKAWSERIVEILEQCAA